MDWYQLDRITGLKGLTPTHAAGIVATTAVHEERVKKGVQCNKRQCAIGISNDLPRIERRFICLQNGKVV